jgi:hypothetical protein
MSIYKKFATDNDRIKNGVRFQIDDVGFTCAYIGQLNPKYLRSAETAYRPYRNQMRTDSLSDAKRDEIEMGVFLDAVLLGWDGVTDEDGHTLPFSKKNAKELLEKLPYLFELLQKLASDIANYRPSTAEDDAKN